MNSGVRLFANLGAEEGPRWRSSGNDPRVAQAARLWAALFSEGSERIDSDSPATWPESLGPRRSGPAFPWLEEEETLVPWLSTEEALDRAAALGVAFHGATPQVTSRVHDKAFSQRVASKHDLHPSHLANCIVDLPSEDFVDPASADARLRKVCSQWPTWARRHFTLKPRHGSSGRGRLAGRDGVIDAASLPGALRRIREAGGAILEPWLDRTKDLSAELYVEANGPPRLLGTLEQDVTPSGLYRGHRGWVDSRGRVFSGLDADEEIREAAVILANAAQREGYYGPAGLDSFLFRPPENAKSTEPDLLRPVVEFNARFTLGIVVLGLVRRALSRIRLSNDLHPEDRLPFFFSLDEPAGGWDTHIGPSSSGNHWFPLWQAGDTTRPGLVVGNSQNEILPH